jgi:hypothetical protein
MQKLTRISLAGVVAIFYLVTLLSLNSAAQEEQRVNEVYQAQAMGQGTQFGQTTSSDTQRRMKSRCS